MHGRYFHNYAIASLHWLPSLDMVDDFQKEMTEANADWQLHSYGNTYHAFTNPEANDPSLGTQFNEDSNNRSWQSMNNFFDEIFS
jgi:dienelactone hydrolase